MSLINWASWCHAWFMILIILALIISSSSTIGTSLQLDITIVQFLRTIQLLLPLNWCRHLMSLTSWGTLIKRHGNDLEIWWSQRVLQLTWCDILLIRRTSRNDSLQLTLNLQEKTRCCVSISVFTYPISQTQLNHGMCVFDGSSFCLQSSLTKEIERRSWGWVLVSSWIEKQLTWQKLRLGLSSKSFNLRLKFCKRCFQMLFISWETWNWTKNIGLTMMKNMLSLKNRLMSQIRDLIKQSLTKLEVLDNSIFKVKDHRDWAILMKNWQIKFFERWPIRRFLQVDK